MAREDQHQATEAEFDPETGVVTAGVSQRMAIVSWVSLARSGPGVPEATYGGSGSGPSRRASGSAIGSMMSDVGSTSRATIVIVTSWWRRTATQ
jgi:hypothetical protein